ncbi:MAG: hypothetical protein JSW43_10005 [Gemmatimonadota bacterium]|nr:MAG: hypothetical protein JSW43_10005 [Gemmatimonadota bacterium]
MSLSRPIGLTLTLLLVAGLACSDSSGPGGGNDGGNGGGGGTGGPITLSGSVQPILNANCAGSSCHIGNSSPPHGLNLTSGQTHANTVGVASGQVPTMNRVEPGQPDQSYLVHMIQGTFSTVGGSGPRMPLGAGSLSQAQIDIIRDWITAGASND